MTAIPHAECGCPLVALEDGSLAVLHGLRGELQPVPSGTSLAFDSRGWGILSAGTIVTRAKDVLNIVVLRAGDGRLYCHNKAQGKTTWLLDAMASHVLKFPPLVLEAAAETLKARCSSVPFDGQCVWWDVAPVQEHLKLQVSHRYSSRWIMVNWRAWQNQCLSMGLPRSGFQEPPDATVCHWPRELISTSWSLSTSCLLVMLAKWSCLLKNAASRATCQTFLARWLMLALPQKFPWLVCLDIRAAGGQDAWPCEKGLGQLLVPVRDGKLQTSDLVQAMEALTSSQMRTLSTPPSRPQLREVHGWQI